VKFIGNDFSSVLMDDCCDRQQFQISVNFYVWNSDSMMKDLQCRTQHVEEQDVLESTGESRSMSCTCADISGDGLTQNSCSRGHSAYEGLSYNL